MTKYMFEATKSKLGGLESSNDFGFAVAFCMIVATILILSI